MKCSSLAKTCSIGSRSGENGGRKSGPAPAAGESLQVDAAWFGTRLARWSGLRFARFRLASRLGRAFDLAGGITEIAASTLALKRRKLEKQLDAILASPTACDLARELQAQIARARHQLLVFCGFPGEVDPTNNACERDLRPAVIQRKITNGYRAMWAAKAEANVRTTIATAKLRGAGTFGTILGTLAQAAALPT